MRIRRLAKAHARSARALATYALATCALTACALATCALAACALAACATARAAPRAATPATAAATSASSAGAKPPLTLERTPARTESARTTASASQHAAAPAPSQHTGASAAAQRAAAPAAAQRAAAPVEDVGLPCGELACLAFQSDSAAFAHVLAERPRVLALGEAHAQKGSEGVPSAARRFADELLPMLAGKAQHIVIELLIADGRCKLDEQRVAQNQKPITLHQAESDQNEFVALGTRAKALGITPHALTPSCEQYREMAHAGVHDVDRMLSTIAALGASSIEKLLSESPADGLVLAYGGALHNDLAPRAGRERWSFGPALAAFTQGRYVELDLIVPEYVKDSESWRAFPWYEAYAKTAHARETLLYAPAPHAFVMIFPKASP